MGLAGLRCMQITFRRLAAYLQLTKPILTLVALVTTLAGFYLGSPTDIDLTRLSLVVAGTALLGAAMAALNQYFERGVDAKMPRTCGRPLPSGRLRPAEVLVFGAAALVASGLLLYGACGTLTAAVAAAIAFSYLCCYMPLKRRTWWCTLVGAVPGALPPVLGYAAGAGTLRLGAWVLFAIVYLWQLPHFFAIARVYRQEYRAAGMPMLPVVDLDGRRTGRQIALFSLGLLVATLWPTYSGMAGLNYLMIALLLGFVFGAFAFHGAVGNSRASARRLFLASVFYLPLLLIAMVLDKMPA